jgi:hypothetical protein
MTAAIPAMSNFEQHLIAADKTASQEGRLWTLTPRRSGRIVLELMPTAILACPGDVSPTNRHCPAIDFLTDPAHVPSRIKMRAGAFTNLPFRGKVVSTQSGMWPFRRQK